MGVYKRGNRYWYKFQFNGKTIRESTKQELELAGLARREPSRLLRDL
jgi:hypothetical protein